MEQRMALLLLDVQAALDELRAMMADPAGVDPEQLDAPGCRVADIKTATALAAAARPDVAHLRKALDQADAAMRALESASGPDGAGGQSQAPRP